MQYSKEEKTMWLDDWRQSGKSAWAYAKANKLNPQTFVKWTKSESKMSFVEVPAQIHAPRTEGSIRHEQEILIEKGDIKIHIPLFVWAEGSRVIMEGLVAL